MKVGDLVVPVLSAEGTEDWISSEVIEDLRHVPWANCFNARVVDTGMLFGCTEKTHRVWKTLEERVGEALVG
jgi:hypothetical protein